jgi:hypothetical protein
MKTVASTQYAHWRKLGKEFRYCRNIRRTYAKVAWYWRAKVRAGQ